MNAIIDDGIEAARHDYVKPGDTLKREGAIHGFEECRAVSRTPHKKIRAQIRDAGKQVMRAAGNRAPIER